MKPSLVFYSTFLDIGKIKIPVIAAINGQAIEGIAAIFEKRKPNFQGN